MLTAAIRQLLYTNTPASVTTPALVWWYGEVPVDADTGWQTTPVPGWDGTLDDYLAALVERYGSDPTLNDGAGPYTFPAGTIVYDCSGFVIAAWRAAGVDLVAHYGLYGSQAFPNSPLPEVAATAIAPGDLAAYSPVNGVGHIVMIHHIDPDGTVEASTSHGVHIGTINWARVTSIKRPAEVAGES